VKLTAHLHLVPRSNNEWSYTSTPPIRLNGLVLRKKHRTTLPLPLLDIGKLSGPGSGSFIPGGRAVGNLWALRKHGTQFVALSGNQTPVIQHEASRYTDSANLDSLHIFVRNGVCSVIKTGIHGEERRMKWASTHAQVG
jgi:hypothetical protein